MSRHDWKIVDQDVKHHLKDQYLIWEQKGKSVQIFKNLPYLYSILSSQFLGIECGADNSMEC